MATITSVDWVTKMETEVHRLTAENARLRAGLNAVESLINESRGVCGLHLNGDEAPWGDLRTGGRYEGWLLAFDDAIDAAKEGA